MWFYVFVFWWQWLIKVFMFDYSWATFSYTFRCCTTLACNQCFLTYAISWCTWTWWNLSCFIFFLNCIFMQCFLMQPLCFHHLGNQAQMTTFMTTLPHPLKCCCFECSWFLAYFFASKVEKVIWSHKEIFVWMGCKTPLVWRCFCHLWGASQCQMKVCTTID